MTKAECMQVQLLMTNESPGARRKREDQLAGDIADVIDKGRREAGIWT